MVSEQLSIPVTQTTSAVVPSILVSAFDVTSSLTMSATLMSPGFVLSPPVPASDVTSSLTISDDLQTPSLRGTANELQLPLPVVSNAASLTGSVYSSSRVSVPAVSSTWLLPSASGTSLQPLMGSAHLYHHSSMAMFSAVPDQSQMYMPAASYPGLCQWATTASTRTDIHSSSHRDFPMTVLEQGTAIASTAVLAHYGNTAEFSATIPVYPSLSASLVREPPSQITNQRHSLSLPYQQGSQVYIYGQGTAGPVPSGELLPCSQAIGPVTYTGTIVSAPPLKRVMVLRQVQPTPVLPSLSISAMDCAGTAEPSTEMSVKGMETPMRIATSLGLQTANQTFCQPKMSEFPKICSSRKSQVYDRTQLSEIGDVSITHPDQSPANLVPPSDTLSPVQREEENLEMKTTLSEPLDAYVMPGEHRDPPWCPIGSPDIEELLSCMDPVGSEKPGCEMDISQKNSLSLQDQGTHEAGIQCSSDWADVNKVVEDMHIPQLLNFLTAVDQHPSPTAINREDNTAIHTKEVDDKSSILQGSCDRFKDKKHKASDPIDEAPKAKLRAQDPECLFLGRVLVGRDADNDRASGNTLQASHCKPPNGASTKTSQTEGNGQEKTKRPREKHYRKDKDTNQSGNKPKAVGKPHSAQRKRKMNAPELLQETFPKPRSSLALHMLESVQVYHALGKKMDKKSGLSCFRALENPTGTKEPQASLAGKSWRDTPHAIKAQEKPQIRAQKRERCCEKESPPQWQDELPPPGKVKLVPLPFLNSERPQPRPVPRKPLSAALCRPTATHPVQPASTHSAPHTAVQPTQAALPSSSHMGPATTAPTAFTNASSLASTTSTQPQSPQSAASRPEPSRTSSCTAPQGDPVTTTVTNPQSPPRPHNQFLLKDFALQRIPWRKHTVAGPLMSSPITTEQRPQREAMKRQAQQERENAAKYTAWGRVQFFVEREKEMEISQKYGYVQ